ncbi:MAG: pyruvate kinase [Chloroflexota bacterium]
MSIKVKNHRPAKRTKIVATLGPASDNEDTLRQMILAGLDVVRINFSHSKPDYLVPVIRRVRKLSEEMKVPIAILGDLRGPRIRVGQIENGSVELKAGQPIRLTPNAITGTREVVAVSYPDLAKDVQVGSFILLDDGNIELQVERLEKDGDVCCRVIQGDRLSSQRGINLPGSPVSLPSITQKDFGDVDFAIDQDFDFLALSFVQSADDVRRLKAYLADKGSDMPVIAKIERQNALEDIHAIAQEAGGVMVARGDLALEMSIQEVPIAQKRIISICRQAAIPVITATQMLESMIEMHKPTRAEATDIANAILDGTDALMLSGETAIGQNPAETVATMSAVALATEKAWLKGDLQGPPPLQPPHDIEAAVAYGGHLIAESLSAQAIVAFTTLGATVRRVVCHRPVQPVLALTIHPATQRRLALSWGVQSTLTKLLKGTDEMIKVGLECAHRCGVAAPGDTVVITAGTPPYGRSGRTNTLKVERIPQPEEQGD